MSGHGFRSLFMAAGVAGAALGCYLVSLNVASERAALEQVESRIVSVERDIRVLETEIGTRGRLAQLERWNARVIRLSAPTADQFVEGGFQLAAMVKPNTRPAIEAPVVLAAAPNDPAMKPRPVTSDGADTAVTRSTVDSTGELLHTASFSKPEPRKAIAAPKAPATVKADASAKPAPVKLTETAKAAKGAAADPLAPLSATRRAANGASPQALPVTSTLPGTTKDSGTAQ